jgi:hypothetical protein
MPLFEQGRNGAFVTFPWRLWLGRNNRILGLVPGAPTRINVRPGQKKYYQSNS